MLGLDEGNHGLSSEDEHRRSNRAQVTFAMLALGVRLDFATGCPSAIARIMINVLQVLIYSV